MARRVSWTNHSSGHDGTTIHRSTATMDPQALPAPIGTVAAGTTEYVDSEALADGTYYYRVQDYQGASVSVASAEQSFVISTGPDYASAAIGDEIGGGVYAGTITYADARQFHIVAGKASSEVYGLKWGNYGVVTGAADPDDGKANQNLVLASFDDGGVQVFYHCRDYVNDGHDDWYLPADNELTLIRTNLSTHAEFSANVTSGKETWTSTETKNTEVWVQNIGTGSRYDYRKDWEDYQCRPVRRVPV